MEIPRISVHALHELIEGGHSSVIIDVRSDVGRSIDTRRIPGALEIALDDIRKAGRELSKSREILLYCNCPNEASAAVAAKALVEAGHATARPLAGGLEAWIAAGHRIDHRIQLTPGGQEPNAVTSLEAARCDDASLPGAS